MRNVPTDGIVAVAPAVNVPATPATVNCVTLKVLPSTSVSFASNPDAALTVSVVSSAIVPVSFVATGASFAPLIVIVRTAMSLKLPSETV